MSESTNLPFGGGLSNPIPLGGGQFVLNRSDMSTAFTDEEYSQCIDALSRGLAVAVSFGVGPLRQAQLVSKTNLGALTFSYTRNDKVESWTVSAYSPHDITTESHTVGTTITASLPLKITGDNITNNGENLTATGVNAWAEGSETKSTGRQSHAEGEKTLASNDQSHAEGSDTTATGKYSHSEGQVVNAIGQSSHAEGVGSVAIGEGSHCEGFNSGGGTYRVNTKLATSAASGDTTLTTVDPLAGGFDFAGCIVVIPVIGYSGNVVSYSGTSVTVTPALDRAAPSSSTISFTTGGATGQGSHAEGRGTLASGKGSHAEGTITVASGTNSHAQGFGTRATGDQSFATGKYNNDGTALLVVGDGTADNTRSDCFKVDSNGETWVKISGVLTKITSLGGGSGIPIYSTLQDAITDQTNLAVGDIFETNGFHTSGDGGAARYVVSTTGTANGMDIVSMGGGKLAIAQLKGSAYTEQIGYVVNSSQADVVPYIERLLAMGIQTIKFYPTGGAPTSCYCIRDMLDLNKSDFHNVGIQLEGADIGQTSGYATWFNFQPSVSNTGKVAIKIHARTTRIKNIVLRYGAGASDSSVRDSSAAICFDSTGDSSYQTSSYGTVLENLTIQGFNTAILSTGTAPYMWHVDCEKITCSANNTHVSLDGQTYCTTFRNCLFNSPDVQSVYLGEPFTVKFDSCNFGIDDRGTCIVRAVKWVVPGAPVDEKRGTILFQNCNMEVEYRNTSVPQNNTHLFIYADDDSLIDYEFDNCCFIYTPLTRENITSDRMMSLGAGSSIIIRNSIGPYADVNYTGNEFYSKDYDKYFFDESRPPEKKIGSLKLDHVIGVDPLVFLDSAHLPCLKRDDDVILYDNNTDLTQFKGLGDGTTLFNLDTFIPSVKVAGKLQACASAPTGVVRIGNELYDYVVIDGRKWITRNLNLRIATRQHTVWDHLEWGQYYKYSDLSAIQSALPSGWRIPNSGDVASLIGDGTSTRAHNLQSLGVSYWTSATNSTGFSALPSTWWNKPNVTPHATFKQYAFYWTSVTEGTNVKNISIAPNAVSSGGWTAGEAASLWIPLRVCCDA